MIEHYVVFRPKAGQEDGLAVALGALGEGLSHGLPGLRALTWGQNTNQSGLSRGYTHGCLGRFDDEAAFQRYWNHPAHGQFMKVLDGICDERFAIDYTTDGGAS